MNAARQRKMSARYYLFEDVLWELPGFASLKAPRPLADLQLLAGVVWTAEGGKGACPVVRMRNGRRNNGSFFLSGKPGSVHLAPKHQGLGGLLHELAHALGSRDKLSHGPAFRRRCIHLYRLYGGWDGDVDWTKPRG